MKFSTKIASIAKLTQLTKITKISLVASLLATVLFSVPSNAADSSASSSTSTQAIPSVTASSSYTWPDQQQAAVVLTYDDTLHSQLDYAVPQLNQHQFVGTFYLSGARGELDKRMNEWRAAAKLGHELGNHTLYHPCRKSLPDRDWVQPFLDLDQYTITQYSEELKTTNTLLQAIDGHTQRTFAYTCGDTTVKNGSVIDAIKPLVTAARDAIPGTNDANNINFYKIKAFDGANKSAQQLIAMVEQAQQNNHLVVLLFHGVGGDYLNVDASAHQQLVQYLADNRKDYWVTTLRDAVQYIKTNSVE